MIDLENTKFTGTVKQQEFAKDIIRKSVRLLNYKIKFIQAKIQEETDEKRLQKMHSSLKRNEENLEKIYALQQKGKINSKFIIENAVKTEEFDGTTLNSFTLSI